MQSEAAGAHSAAPAPAAAALAPGSAFDPDDFGAYDVAPEPPRAMSRAAPGGYAAAPVSRASPTVAPRASTGARAAPAIVPPAAATKPAGGSSWIQHAYLVLLLALIPLAWHTFAAGDQATPQDRLIETIADHPEAERALEALSSESTVDEVFNVLPGHRLKGAFLARDSHAHWLFAIVSAIAFVGMALAIFPERAGRLRGVLLVGLFTGTVGVVLLLGFQYAADFTADMTIIPRGFIGLIMLIVKLIGYSYRAADDPQSNFFISCIGFTFGVGLCEELCKATPILYRLKTADADGLLGFTWRDACRWGFISGVGFGVAEGIMYSGDMYNGIFGPGVYVVRFVSCVALHAVWSGAAGVVLVRRQHLLHAADSWWQLLFNVMLLLAVPMLLHGLYDTLLKKDLPGIALLTALASFAWLIWQVQRMRRKERAAAAYGFALPA